MLCQYATIFVGPYNSQEILCLFFQINVKNSDDKSVLHIAIGEGLRRVVEVLLEFHPDVDIQVRLGDVFSQKSQLHIPGRYFLTKWLHLELHTPFCFVCIS